MSKVLIWKKETWLPFSRNLNWTGFTGCWTGIWIEKTGRGIYWIAVQRNSPSKKNWISLVPILSLFNFVCNLFVQFNYNSHPVCYFDFIFILGIYIQKSFRSRHSFHNKLNLQMNLKVNHAVIFQFCYDQQAFRINFPDSDILWSTSTFSIFIFLEK